MLAALATSAWALSTGAAHARGGDDVYWSIGVNSPGVAVGVSNAPPVVVHQSYPSYTPYPVYQPRPVYQRPIVIQHNPVVVHQPYPYRYVQPVVVAPQPYYHPGRGHQHHWKGHHGRGHDRHDRDWDDDRRGHGRH
jgi:hypothetical protein